MTRKLSLSNIQIRLHDDLLFPPLDLDVDRGEVVTIMGPSGSGKSTLLAYICGTLDSNFVAQGSVRLGDQILNDLPPEARRIGILFQDDLLFPHLSVRDNLAFGLPAHLDKKSRNNEIDQALSQAGLEGLGERDPATLSGGQRARVGCLRTLLSAPCALLLDEPFSKLDVELRGRFRTFVFNLAIERRLPVLLVTHDPSDADAAGGRIITF